MSTNQAERWIEMVPGIRRRTLVSGGGMMQMLVQLDAGANLPAHQHPHEQIAYVLRGVSPRATATGCASRSARSPAS